MALDVEVDVVGIQQHLLAADAALVVHLLDYLVTVITKLVLVLVDGDSMGVLGVVPHVVQGDGQLADLADCLASIRHVAAELLILGFCYHLKAIYKGRNLG